MRSVYNMSICDLDKVDAVGKDKKENALRMMLADHLDWEDEGIHLEILQDKINYYLQYITNKQYLQDYGEIPKFIIVIFFKYPITDNCNKFIEVVSEQLNEENIFLEIHIDEEG